jgi:hypothetical protein
MGLVIRLLAVVGALSIVGLGALLYWSASGGGAKMSREMHEARARGAAIGAATDTHGCVRKAYSELEACERAMCRAEVGVGFLGACLELASPNPSACKEFEGLVTEERDWTAEYCEVIGRPYDLCIMVIPYLLQHCQTVKDGAA